METILCTPVHGPWMELKLKHAEQTLDQLCQDATGERPVDQFQIERNHRRALPTQAYRAVETAFRSSTRDCVISCGGNFYNVPTRYAARRHLRVEVCAEEIAIDHNHDRIARHRLCQDKHHRIVDPKHLEGLLPAATLTPLQHKLQELRALGPAPASLDGLVRIQTRFLPWHMGRPREMLFKVGPQTLQPTMTRATRSQAFDARPVQSLCRPTIRLRSSGGENPVLIATVLAPLMSRLAQGQVHPRNLQEYETLYTTPSES